MATLIQLRRDTSANWSSNNPTLSSGEIGIATDLQQFKIGNSASSWNQLEYVNAIPSQYLSLIAASANFLTKADASIIYAPLGSASFVGVPTAPTATAGTNTHQIATTAFVRTEVTNLIDSAPGALDTLNELAAALGDDPNYAVSTASYIATKLDINNASATYLSISNAALTYVPISASSNIVDNYIPISSSYAYLTRDDASSLYIPITASGPYLTELEASVLYVPISASANVVENYIPISSSYAYLTRSDAENTYIPISSSAEYLTESEAQGIYVPISSSANIVENYIPVSASFAYLTRSDAESTYIPITASAEYLTESEAQDIYVPISSSANIVENYIPVSSSYAYLTRVDAENTYIPISSSAEYLTESEAAGIYVPISASFNIRTGLLEQSEAANVYAPLFSASLTGVPVAPTATSGTNTKQIATTEFVRTEITNLVDSAPNTLDTLNELAAALGDDPNFATSTASAIGQRLTIANASATYLSMSDAQLTYIPISASGEYLTESEAQEIYVPISSSANIVENYIPISSSFAYLTRTDAESTYIPITSSAAYLTESEAESIYVPITASSGIVENYIPISSSYAYLTRVDAESIYIPISSSAEYLTELEAAGIYVPISSSANIVENYIPVSSSYAYLTRTDAETIYIPITSSAAYLTEAEAAGLYIPISASFGTFDADKLDGRDSSYFINTSSESQEKLGDITFHGTVSIEDLVITGSALTISTTNLALTDSIIQLAHEQYSTDSVDIGIIGSYGDGTTSSAAHYHASFARDASQNKWKLLSNGPAPVNNVIDYSDPSVEYGVLQVGAVEVSSSAKVNNLNADLLDDQNGSYYLDWTNTTNKPDPIIGVNLLGNVTGAASATLTDLTNGQISINTTVAENSVALGTNTTGNYVANVTAGNGITISGAAGEGWSPTVSINSDTASVTFANVISKPTTLSGYGITDALPASASSNFATVTVSTNAQTGTAYTLVLTDAGRLIEMNNANANTLTVPLNSSVPFPIGTKIDIIQTGAGATSISPTAGVTLNSEAGKRTVNAQWQAATLVKRATDTWVMIGALKA